MNIIILVVCLIFIPSISFGQTKHVIQRGETLELIAKRYGISVSEIREKNPLVDECYTGLTLFIPPKPQPIVNITKTETRRGNSEGQYVRKVRSVQTEPQQNFVQEGYVPIYNPYWNMWQSQYDQLQSASNTFYNQMMQQAQQSWNNYQVNYSNLWNSIPNIDYSAMPMPVLDGTSTSIETSVGISDSNTHSTRTPKTCGACDGKGWIPETKGVASFGLDDKWCSECNKQVAANHYHATCPSCKGKGVW